MESLHDVEALCLEICAELREVVEMLATYRDTIGDAARLIARAARYPLIGGQETAELARELAMMAHICEHRRGAVRPLLDIRRVARPPQGDTHLLGDPGQRVAGDLQLDGGETGLLMGRG